MQHGTPVFDVEHTIEDEAGNRRLFSISGPPLFQDAVPADGAQASSGTPSGAVFVLQDITEQRASERALRRSEERFRVATEQAVDVVALFNPDGTVQYVSPSVEQITGFDRASFIGNDGFALVHPGDYERLLTAFNTALHHPDTPVEVVGRYRHRDGSWRHLSIRGRRITSQDGTPQVLANIRDVTDAKHRRAALLDAKQAAEEASALKFTEAGGTVAVRAQTDGSAVVLTVTDDGIGMDPDFVAEAFQAFRQESTGNSREVEGSGLGLAICEHYVDLLGSTIRIESEKGVGTTVTVRLPQRS